MDNNIDTSKILLLVLFTFEVSSFQKYILSLKSLSLIGKRFHFDVLSELHHCSLITMARYCVPN